MVRRRDLRQQRDEFVPGSRLQGPRTVDGGNSQLQGPRTNAAPGPGRGPRPTDGASPSLRNPRPKSQMDAAQNRGRGRQQINPANPPAMPGASLRNRLPEVGRQQEDEPFTIPGHAQRTPPTNVSGGNGPPQQENTQREDVSSATDAAETPRGSGGDSTLARLDGLRRSGGSALFRQPTEEGVTQFQRRQHLDAARDRHALEREAFGAARGAGRAETAVRSSLRGRDRMDETLRQNAMTSEEREREAGMISGAAQQDAAALREARGLRQERDISEQELAGRERDSQRRFQASLADTQARAAGRQQQSPRVSMNTPLSELGGRSRQEISQDVAPSVNAALSSAGIEVQEGEDVGGAFANFLGTSVQNAQNMPGVTDMQDLVDLYAIARSIPQAATRSSSKSEPMDAEATLKMIQEGALNQTSGAFQRGDRLNVGSDQLRLRQFEGRARSGIERIMQNYRQDVEGRAIGALAESGELPANSFNQHERRFAEETIREQGREVALDTQKIDQELRQLRETQFRSGAEERRGNPQTGITGQIQRDPARAAQSEARRNRIRELERRKQAEEERVNNMSLQELAVEIQAQRTAQGANDEMRNL